MTADRRACAALARLMHSPWAVTCPSHFVRANAAGDKVKDKAAASIPEAATAASFRDMAVILLLNKYRDIVSSVLIMEEYTPLRITPLNEVLVRLQKHIEQHVRDIQLAFISALDSSVILPSRQRKHAVNLIEVDGEAVAVGNRNRGAVVPKRDQRFCRARRRVVIRHRVAERP